MESQQVRAIVTSLFSSSINVNNGMLSEISLFFGAVGVLLLSLMELITKTHIKIPQKDNYLPQHISLRLNGYFNNNIHVHFWKCIFGLSSLLMVPNFFHFTNIEATMLLGRFKALEMVSYPWPGLYLTKIYKSYLQEFLGLHGLVFVLTCSVNCGALYTQVCAFLNYVQSIKFASRYWTHQGS